MISQLEVYDQLHSSLMYNAKDTIAGICHHWLVDEISHVDCWKASEMTLHQKEFVTCVVLNIGLSSAGNFHEPVVNVFRIVRHGADCRKWAAIAVCHASRNIEENYPLAEKVGFASEALHGSCQIGYVPRARIFFRT